MATIHDVMEYGPILFNDPDSDVLITINGAYLNWWAGDYSGNYECRDCRPQGRQDGLYGYDITHAMRKAEDYFIDAMAEEAIETESNS